MRAGVLVLVVVALAVESAEAGMWVEHTSPTHPAAMDDSAGVGLNGAFFTVGGKTSVDTHNEVWVWTVADGWVQLAVSVVDVNGAPAPPLPDVEDHVVAGVEPDVLFVQYETEVLVANVSGVASSGAITFVAGPPLPNGSETKDSAGTGWRHPVTGAVHLLVMMGFDRGLPDDPLVSAVYDFDYAAWSWSVMDTNASAAGIPVPRQDATCVAAGDGRVYMFGGADDDDFDDLWVLDPATGAWTLLGPPAVRPPPPFFWPGGRSDAVLVPLDVDLLVVVGGNEKIVLYNTTTGRWIADPVDDFRARDELGVGSILLPVPGTALANTSSLAIPVVRKDNVAGAISSRSLLLFGGDADEGGRIGDTWIYTLDACPHNCSASLPSGGANACGRQLGMCTCAFPSVDVQAGLDAGSELADAGLGEPLDGLFDALRVHPHLAQVALLPDCAPRLVNNPPSPPPPPPPSPPPPAPPPPPTVAATLVAAPPASSSKTLAIALGVTIPLVCLCAIALILLFALYHKRKSATVTYLLKAHADVLIPPTELEMGGEVGRGAFGVVHRALWKGDVVAVKKLTLLGVAPPASKDVAGTAASGAGDDVEAGVGAVDPAYQAALAEFASEASVLLKCRHPNVTLLLGLSLEPPLLVSEFMARGSLFSVLANPSVTIDTTMMYSWAAGIISGLRFLHANGITHRDLKSLNVLLSDGWMAKLNDFGLSKFAAPESTTADDAPDGIGTNAPLGTLLWAAPELLDGSITSYEGADIYALGVVMWEIAARQPPYGTVLDPVVVALRLLNNTIELPLDVLAPGISPVYVDTMVAALTRFAPARPSLDTMAASLAQIHNPARLVYPIAAREPEGHVHTVSFVVPGIHTLLALPHAAAAAHLTAVHTAVRSVVASSGVFLESSTIDSIIVVGADLGQLIRVVSLVIRRIDAAFATLPRCPVAVFAIFSAGSASISAYDARTGAAVYEGPGLSRARAAAHWVATASSPAAIAAGTHFGAGVVVATNTAASNADLAELKASASETCGGAGAVVFVDSFEWDAASSMATQFALDGFEAVADDVLAASASLVAVRDGVLSHAKCIMRSDAGIRATITAFDGEWATLAAAATAAADVRVDTVSADFVRSVSAPPARPVGVGSFGRVFFATSPTATGSGDVAVKVMLQDRLPPAALVHFAAQLYTVARTHASLRAVVPVVAACLTPGALAIVTARAPGLSISQLPLAALHYPRRLGVARAFAAALAELHAAGVAHGSIRPGNVHVDDATSPPTVVFSDVALWSIKTNLSTMTVSPSVAYSAPELLRGEDPTVVSDVFSAAVVVLTVLAPAAVAAWSAGPPMRLAMEIMSSGVNATAIFPSASPPALAALQRCLALNPADRATAADLVAAVAMF